MNKHEIRYREILERTEMADCIFRNMVWPTEYTAEELVAMYEREREMPRWFSAHDRGCVVKRVRNDLKWRAEVEAQEAEHAEWMRETQELRHG